MDKDILDYCELEAIETETEESEAIVARVIDCRQKIELFIVSTTTGGVFLPQLFHMSLCHLQLHHKIRHRLPLLHHQNPDFQNLYCRSLKVMSRIGLRFGIHLSLQYMTITIYPRWTSLII